MKIKAKKNLLQDVMILKMDLSESVLTLAYFITYVDIGRNIFASRKPLFWMKSICFKLSLNIYFYLRLARLDKNFKTK